MNKKLLDLSIITCFTSISRKEFLNIPKYKENLVKGEICQFSEPNLSSHSQLLKTEYSNYMIGYFLKNVNGHVIVQAVAVKLHENSDHNHFIIH